MKSLSNIRGDSGVALRSMRQLSGFGGQTIETGLRFRKGGTTNSDVWHPLPLRSSASSETRIQPPATTSCDRAVAVHSREVTARSGVATGLEPASRPPRGEFASHRKGLGHDVQGQTLPRLRASEPRNGTCI